jgi:hypothetical protein
MLIAEVRLQISEVTPQTLTRVACAGRFTSAI